jgi:release factor glutamine methyltransferase
MERWSIGRLLETAAGYLKDKGSDSPRLDAELLLAETLHLERIELYTQYERPLTTEEVDSYRALIARRAAHEPVAYILGRSHFRHLCLAVDPAVLVPRPETEELVDLALDTLRRRPPWGDLRGSLAAARDPVIADVGTGSGAIAISLAREGEVRVLATDESQEALRVAGANAVSAV